MSERLGKYWRNRPLVFSLLAALPGALGITEVDLDAAVDRELDVLQHLLALVPGQRAAQLLGQRADALDQSVADRFGTVALGQLDELAGSGWSARPRSLFLWEFAEQEIPFPVAGDGAVFDLGGALRDHHAAGDLALALVLWALGSRVARYAGRV